MTVVTFGVMARQARGDSTALPPNVTQAMVQQGDVLFHGQGRCFKCHGSDAKGTAKAPGLTAPKKWININGNYEQIVQVVTNGVPEPKEHSSPMPAKGKANLSDDEVHAVSAYVWSISH
jgi:mono/diheme cytochrome c family protein